MNKDDLPDRELYKPEDILLPDHGGKCSICNQPFELHYKYKTKKLGEGGINPLESIVHECKNCNTLLEVKTNGFFIIGEIVDFDASIIKIKSYPRPPSEDTIEFENITTIEHCLDLSRLKWYRDNLEPVEILVIDNKAIRLMG